MAIADTIISMQENLKNAYDSVEQKGVTIEGNKNLSNLSNSIDSIDIVSDYINFDNFNVSNNPNSLKVFVNLKLNCSNRTKLTSTFINCSNLETLELYNTQNVINLDVMCDGCISLKKLTVEDCSSVISSFCMYNNASNLEEVYGFKNYGKGFTEQKNNYNNYGLYFNKSNKLTHDSIIEILNNIYDLNLTYDVANGGTLYTQILMLGSTNLAKLTDEEKAIATMKGWVLS